MSLELILSCAGGYLVLTPLAGTPHPFSLVPVLVINGKNTDFFYDYVTSDVSFCISTSQEGG